MNRIRSSIFILTTAALLATGCASTSAPDAAKGQGRSVEDISRQWKQGDDLTKAGEARKAEGQRTIEAGKAKVAEGDDMIGRGQALKDESEKAFRDASKRADAR